MNKRVSTKCLAQIHPQNTKLLPEEPGDDDSGSEMVAEQLCLKFDVVAAVDNCFVADSCLVVSGDVAGGGGAGSYIGGGGGDDGGEGPHPPRSTYQTVNTSLKTSKFCQSSCHTFMGIFHSMWCLQNSHAHNLSEILGDSAIGESRK